MIQTKNVEQDVNLLIASFYEKPFKFSYSSMNKLIGAPGIFFKEYILKQRENIFAKYLLEGILIHYLVLENQGFDDKFIVSGESLPSPNNVIIAEYCFKEGYLNQEDETLELRDFETLILNQLKEINLHQALKDTKDGTGDSKRIGKIVEPRTEEYFNFLKKKQGKTIIDSELLDKCTRRADIIKADPKIRNLLGLDLISDGRTFGVYNEHLLEVETDEEMLFGYKGYVDNLVVDVLNKKVRINDFKTTSKSLTNFEESVEFWNYWLQAAIYMKLVQKFLGNVLTDEWIIEFRFIVFDKYDQMYPFLVTNETMAKWTNRWKEIEKEAKYHYDSKDYTLPYEYALGNVKL